MFAQIDLGRVNSLATMAGEKKNLQKCMTLYLHPAAYRIKVEI